MMVDYYHVTQDHRRCLWKRWLGELPMVEISVMILIAIHSAQKWSKQTLEDIILR